MLPVRGLWTETTHFLIRPGSTCRYYHVAPEAFPLSFGHCTTRDGSCFARIMVSICSQAHLTDSIQEVCNGGPREASLSSRPAH